MSLLTLNAVCAGYRNKAVLRDVDLEVGEGQLVVLLGPNATGKSTLLRTIIGELEPSGGNIFLGGDDITQESTHQRVLRGLSLVPEVKAVFPEFSVEDNMVLGLYPFRKQKIDPRPRLASIYELFPDLERLRLKPAGTLSGGLQKMLAIGRSLIVSPRLLLLDEPSLGLSPKFVSEVFGRLTDIREKFDVSILLVEQNARMSLKYADYGYVLENGAIVTQGEADELLAAPRIREAYLGL